MPYFAIFKAKIQVAKLKHHIKYPIIAYPLWLILGLYTICFTYSENIPSHKYLIFKFMEKI